MKGCVFWFFMGIVFALALTWLELEKPFLVGGLYVGLCVITKVGDVFRRATKKGSAMF